jgi:hypothetical protein
MLLNVMMLVPCLVPWKVNRSVPLAPTIVALAVFTLLANALFTKVIVVLSYVGSQ